jgi:hypothetical protein
LIIAKNIEAIFLCYIFLNQNTYILTHTKGMHAWGYSSVIEHLPGWHAQDPQFTPQHCKKSASSKYTGYKQQSQEGIGCG